MSRIRELTGQIASIPAKERRKDQVGALDSTFEKVTKLVTSAMRSADVCISVRPIGGASFAGRAAQDLSRATDSAAQLREYLIGGGQIVGSNRLDQLLTSLSERVLGAERVIQRGWSGLVQGYASRYRPLADVASQIRLPGAAQFHGALAQVEKWEATAPTSIDAANRFNHAVEKVLASVKDLGIEGKPGVFMIAAASGSASARDLQNPDIQTFLARHPAVWDMLRVKL